MLDIILLLAGQRFCPWCSQRGDTIGDRITDRLPIALVRLLLRYDALVGRLGVALHGRLHAPGGR